MIIFEGLMVLLLIASFVFGRFIVNRVYKWYMKVMDIDALFIKPRTKIVHYIIVGGIIWVLVLKIFLKV